MVVLVFDRAEWLTKVVGWNPTLRLLAKGRDVRRDGGVDVVCHVGGSALAG